MHSSVRRHAPRVARPLVLAATLALVACATPAYTIRVGGVPVTIPASGGAGDRAPRRTVPTLPSPSAKRVISTAEDYLGVPYVWGGTSPKTGFDCSGYVQYVYGKEGVRLPRTSRQQAVAGARRETRWSAAAPGDLVMFAKAGEPISHVAFYLGGGRILHASSSGGAVRYDDLDTPRGRWFRDRLAAVRHVSDDGPAIARGLLERLGLTNVPLDPPDGAPRPR